MVQTNVSFFCSPIIFVHRPRCNPPLFLHLNISKQLARSSAVVPTLLLTLLPIWASFLHFFLFRLSSFLIAVFLAPAQLL